jgi:hypothetical protein
MYTHCRNSFYNRHIEVNHLHKLDMAEVFGNVEVGRIWGTPGSKTLVGKCFGANNGSEKVHPPFSASCRAIVNIEQPQWNVDLTGPGLARFVQLRVPLESITNRVSNEEMIECCSGATGLARIIDEGLVRNIVGVDLIFEIRLWVVSAFLDESLHHLVLIEVAIGSLRWVEVEVDLIVCGECNIDRRVRVAEIDLREGEVCQIRDGFGVGNGADSRAGWGFETRNCGASYGSDASSHTDKNNGLHFEVLADSLSVSIDFCGVRSKLFRSKLFR